MIDLTGLLAGAQRRKDQEQGLSLANLLQVPGAVAAMNIPRNARSFAGNLSQMLGRPAPQVGAELGKLNLSKPEDQQKAIAIAANVDPGLADRLMQMFEMTKPAERKTTNVSPGQQVVDTATGEVIYEAPEAAKESRFTEIRELPDGRLVGLKDGKMQIVPATDEAALAVQDARRIKEAQAELEALDENWQRAAKLRGELSSATADFQKIKGAYDRIQASASSPSAAGDLALIFNYMKMLDPGSTVREGEFATAQSAGGVDSRVWGLYNRIVSGERLTEDQRRDFLGQSGNIFSAVKESNDAKINGFVKLGEKYGLSRDDIVVEGLDTGKDVSEMTDDEILRLLGAAN